MRRDEGYVNPITRNRLLHEKRRVASVDILFNPGEVLRGLWPGADSYYSEN
jgi:hypothetical protein